MNLSVNKSLKDILRQSFQEWYASQIHLQLANGGIHEPVDFCLGILKPLSTQWFMDAFSHVQILLKMALWKQELVKSFKTYKISSTLIN